MLRLSDSRNFSRTLTGLCLIVAPLALLAAALIGPDYIDNDNLAAELENIALHNRRFVVSLVLFFVAGILVILAGIGLVRLFRSARVTLGQAAGALLVLGGAATMGFYTISAIEYEMTRHDLDRVEMAKLAEQFQESGVLAPVWILFLIGTVIGSVLLAVAAFRRGLLPIWAAVALVVANVFGFLGEESKEFEIAGFAVLLLGLGTLGLAVLRMSDDEWDGAPATAAPPVA